MPATPTANVIVAELLERRPGAVAAFVRRGMACPGCAMARFETLADTAVAYGLDLPGFLEELGGAGAAPAPGAGRRAR